MSVYLSIYLSIYTVYNFLPALVICITSMASFYGGLGADAATHHGRQVGDVGRGAGEPFASTRSVALVERENAVEKMGSY
jgi:hypothetical protein